MTTLKHSKGPWATEPTTDEGGMTILGKEEGVVVSHNVRYIDTFNGDDQHVPIPPHVVQANRNTIALSPLMAEFMKQVANLKGTDIGHRLKLEAQNIVLGLESGTEPPEPK